MSYSALIPAYNAEATIRETVESVLLQTVPPAEIIVVDDGSTDKTAAFAAACDPCVRVISQANAGVGHATTTAIREAAYPVIASVDADDLWLPEKMERQFAHLDANPECQGVFTHLRTFRTDGLSASANTSGPGWSRSTMTILTAAALAVGAVIDPPGSRGDMIDWISRARHQGLRLDMMDDILTLRRVHPGSMSYGRDAERDRGYAHVAWLALQRRKGGQTR